ncbi:hypothetical protein [uncultured Roseobacter sp.]|uniref:hypothetical protein n=1 Tax=uncultured Roseobacter sp. TaxID=114847 RepID=UPI0026158B8A|nr:hypothetical protein [uncultured Roseobacter sp.]
MISIGHFRSFLRPDQKGWPTSHRQKRMAGLRRDGIKDLLVTGFAGRVNQRHARLRTSATRHSLGRKMATDTMKQATACISQSPAFKVKFKQGIDVLISHAFVL